MNLKKYKNLPVYIVEDHNEALKHIYKCMGSRHMPLMGNSIIHFDSHPDLIVPKEMTADTVWNKEEVLRDLSIENWLIPACYAGHFDTVHWVKPHWSNQIPLGNYTIRLGKYNNRIRLYSSIYYFLSDGVCVTENLLDNPQELTLTVTSVTDRDYVQSETLDKHYILDVDMDFFSTKNPFKELLNAGGLYDKLKPLFSFDIPDNLHLDITKNEIEETDNKELICRVSEKRYEQLEKLNKIFIGLENGDCLKNLKTEFDENVLCSLQDIFECVEKYYDKTDWWLIHAAGSTWDARELPHHVSTLEELYEEFNQFEEYLKSLKTPPVMITLARSTNDDYCPASQVELIQRSIVEIIKKIFGNVSVFLDYESADD